jgi:hypothetical protein
VASAMTPSELRGIISATCLIFLHRGAPPKLGEAHKAFLARIGFSRRPTFLSRMSASSKVRG